MKIKQNLKNFYKAFIGYSNFIKIKKIESKTIFYLEKSSDWEFLKSIYYELEKLDKNLVIVTSERNSDIQQSLKISYIGSGIFRTIFFKSLKSKLLITTMPDLDVYHIKRSIYNVKYIYIFHSLVSSHRIYNQNAFDAYDFIFCATKKHVEEIRIREKIFNLKRKKLISFGYTRLDIILESLEKKSFFKGNKNVLLAPTWGTEFTEIKFLTKIINLFLVNGYNTCLRLHPMTVLKNQGLVKEIKKKYIKSKNFNIDNSNLGIKNFYTYDNLITDWSGIALEFAFAKLTPVIFIDTKPKIRNPEWLKISAICIEDQIRNKIGLIIKKKNIQNIDKVIDQIDKDKKNWQEVILEQRNKLISNIGKSAKIYANYIYNIVD